MEKRKKIKRNKKEKLKWAKGEGVKQGIKTGGENGEKKRKGYKFNIKEWEHREKEKREEEKKKQERRKG